MTKLCIECGKLIEKKGHRVTCSEKCIRKHKLKRMKINTANRRDRETAKDPEWNAKRQRAFRAKNPILFNKIMARCYLKKLPKDEIKKLLGEFL